MTYKKKMEKEHPSVDSDFVHFSCPGDFIPGGPKAGTESCVPGRRCADCWLMEIPEKESKEKTFATKIANRVKALYTAFREEDLNHAEAFELAKMIIFLEVLNGNSSTTLF